VRGKEQYDFVEQEYHIPADRDDPYKIEPNAHLIFQNSQRYTPLP
jgi:hypothetical protein